MKELENIYLDHGRNGSKHWIAQRLSAILLTPLSLWLIADGSNYIYKEYSTAVQWISKPFIATLLGATLTLFLFHSYLGIVVIVEDYSRGLLRHILIRTTASIFLLTAIASIGSIVMLSF